MTLSTGQVLNNRYRIVKLLAVGGYGAVYRAWDLTNAIPCAIKENLDSSPESQRQFAREGDFLTQLSHPNLPRVFEHFIISGQGQYLIMDFIDGESLEAMRCHNGGALAESVVLPWIDQIFGALTYMHSQNPPVIHRDIKPANICITPQGKAILVDFGIAKHNTSGHTTRGAKAVTPGFSPPEQYTGAGTDQRSDIYALGATLYTVLTGIELPESINRMIGQNKTQPPHLVVPGVQLRVSAAIMRAINPDRANRFDTIAEFQAALNGKAIRQPGGQVIGIPWKPVAIIGAAVLLIAGIIFGGKTWPPQTPATNTPAFNSAQSSTSTQSRLSTVANTVQPTITNAPMATNQPALPPPTKPASTQIPTTIPTPAPTPSDAKPVPKGMVYIPGGLFSMGANQSEMEWHFNSCNSYAKCYIGDYTDMMPRHDVRLSPFFIDIHEVTNAEYRQCINAGKCGESYADRIKRYLESDYATNRKYDNYPVVAITWADAKSYCQWAGNKTLPSEAQWERAAKGDDDWFYPWVRRPTGTSAQSVFGSSTPLANFCDNGCPMENWDETRLSDGYTGPAPVGNFGPGPFGLYDMAGNVTEWVLDVYSVDFYSNSTGNDPVFQGSGKWHVTRGGGWNNGIYAISSVARSAQEPTDPKAFIGFRCVQPAP